MRDKKNGGDRAGELRRVDLERVKSHSAIESWEKKEEIKRQIALRQEAILVELDGMKLEVVDDIRDNGFSAMDRVYEQYVLMCAMCMATGEEDEALLIWGRELTKLLGWGPSKAKGKKLTPTESAAAFREQVNKARGAG